MYIIKVYWNHLIIKNAFCVSYWKPKDKYYTSSIRTKCLTPTISSLLVHTYKTGHDSAACSVQLFAGWWAVLVTTWKSIVSLWFTPVVAPRYTVELACGFGVTVLLVVVLIVVYHVYWLEMVLFYRAHFGTDETILGE